MKQLQFKTYENFAYDIGDTFESMNHNYKDVSIIAKYNDAKEIIKELIYLEYNVVSVDLNIEEEYCDEYIITLNLDGIWCEKFKRDTGYTINGSDVTYIMNDCNSSVIKHCVGDIVYEVSVEFDDDDDDNYEDTDYDEYDEDDYTEDDYEDDENDSYTINGHVVDKETFLRYISRFAPDLAKELMENSTSEEYSSDDLYDLLFDMMFDIINKSNQFMNVLYLI